MDSKVCYRCKVSQPICNFTKDKTRKDGLNSYCKVCQKVLRTIWPSYHAKHEPLYDGTKTCSHCRMSKPPTEFVKYSRCEDGLYYYCKDCVKLLKRTLPSYNNERWRTYANKTLYGLEETEFHSMLEKQGNCCAICEIIFENVGRAYIDHDHVTNLFRGFLCTKCNSALGFFNDNVEVLENAIQYLKKFGARQAENSANQLDIEKINENTNDSLEIN